MAEKKNNLNLIPARRIESAILMARGQRVLLDRDLAMLYGVETRVLNQAVRRNRARFPSDFMYELTRGEILRMSQIVISPDGKGELKYSKSVFVFTEQGVAMLSSVLNSQRAVQVNIEIMRAFVRLREILAADADLSRKLAALEQKYDGQFKVVFAAIRGLMVDKKKPKHEIGFHTLMSKPPQTGGSKAKKISP
jgi:hypothetical protein